MQYCHTVQSVLWRIFGWRYCVFLSFFSFIGHCIAKLVQGPSIENRYSGCHMHMSLSHGNCGRVDQTSRPSIINTVKYYSDSWFPPLIGVKRERQEAKWWFGNNFTLVPTKAPSAACSKQLILAHKTDKICPRSSQPQPSSRKFNAKVVMSSNFRHPPLHPVLEPNRGREGILLLRKVKGPPPTNLISPPFCSAGPQFLFHRRTCLQKEMEGEGRIPAKGRNNLSKSFHVKRYVGRDEFLITSSVLLHSRCKKVGRLNRVRALAECTVWPEMSATFKIFIIYNF